MKSKEIKYSLDELSKSMFGRSKSECSLEKICVICHESVNEFKDKLSEKEYNISGMCQNCQDNFFK